jgi:uncharacterized protein YdhG (YjbR/CyaY superfamily)
MANTDYKNIDEYLGTLPEEVQLLLEEIRQLVWEEVPDAKETISYQLPAFKLNGRVLIYFAGWKNHISIYPILSEMETSLKGLSAYKTSGKGTVQFPLDKPLPLPLIREIVRFQVKKNLQKQK